MRSILLAVVVATLALPATAQAWVYTNITDFNLTQTAVTYGTYSISVSGDGSASYRWDDVPTKDTVISGNNCSDGSVYSSPRNIPAGDTSYYGLFGGKAADTCFLLRGRVATGQGSMTNYDGILRR